VTEFETEAGPTDYALWDRNEPLGVVEAKKVTAPKACSLRRSATRGVSRPTRSNGSRYLREGLGGPSETRE
jgi:hypothetical protein